MVSYPEHMERERDVRLIHNWMAASWIKMDPQMVFRASLVALLLTVFYRKDFTFRSLQGSRLLQTLQLSLFLWITPLLMPQSFPHELLAVIDILFAVIGIFFVLKEMYYFPKEEKAKTAVLSYVLLLIPNYDAGTLSCLAVISTVTQLLRWPVWLKNHLREIRIIFGPVYALFVIGGCVQAGTSILLISAVMATVSAVLLRPDNKELLKFVLRSQTVPSTQARKSVHGVLNLLSLVLVVIHVILNRNANKTLFNVAILSYVLSTVLYLFVADFPRLVWRTITP